MQVCFQVNVTMAPFIFTSDEFIEGIIMANYTGGAPVHGNLTLKATVRPFRSSNLYIKDLSPISEKYLYFVSCNSHVFICLIQTCFHIKKIFRMNRSLFGFPYKDVNHLTEFLI